MSALDGADMPRESLGSRQWENKFRMNFMFHFRGAKSGIRQIATRAHAGSLFLFPLAPLPSQRPPALAARFALVFSARSFSYKDRVSCRLDTHLTLATHLYINFARLTAGFNLQSKTHRQPF